MQKPDHFKPPADAALPRSFTTHLNREALFEFGRWWEAYTAAQRAKAQQSDKAA